MAGWENADLQLKIDEYEKMLFGIAFVRLGNREDAEDAVQETFYRYLKRMQQEGFGDAEHEKAWLIRVIVNLCGKYRASAWFRHRTAQPPMETAGEGDMAPEKQAFEAERRERLLAAVMALPVKYRDVIHLFYYEGMTVREIGRVLGRKESTVTSQLTRGRALLRQSLKEEYDFA